MLLLTSPAIFVAVAALGLGVLPIVDTPAPATSITCVNPASGATWQISVDYQGRTVNAYPANISTSTISWHDGTDGGNYTLDRRSGNLTAVFPSSTGGYFLFDHCQTGD
jgi:hypothetical protein